MLDPTTGEIVERRLEQAASCQTPDKSATCGRPAGIRWLEDILDRELHDSGSYVGLNLPEGAAVQNRAIGPARRNAGGSGIQEIRVIGHVERFPPNLQALPLRDGELA